MVPAQLVWLVLVSTDLILLQLHRLEERLWHGLVRDRIGDCGILVELLTLPS